MWWKIAVAIVVVWLAFGLIVALVKGLAALAVLGLLALGVVTAVKWFTRADKPSAGLPADR
ncbi:hypothetical protein [Williamsia sp. M5A3_1d]